MLKAMRAGTGPCDVGSNVVHWLFQGSRDRKMAAGAHVVSWRSGTKEVVSGWMLLRTNRTKKSPDWRH
jgi:hypothetical protein